MRLSTNALMRLARIYGKLPFQKWVVYVLAYEWKTTETLKKKPPEGVRFAEATLEDLDALAACAPDAGKRDLFARRLQAGRRCYAAFAEKAIIGYLWVSSQITPELEDAPPIKLAANEVYFFDGYVVPQWRCKNIQYFCGLAGGEAMMKLGCRAGVSMIKSFNRASLAASAQVGRPVAVLEQRVFLKWERWRSRPFTPAETASIRRLARHAPAAWGDKSMEVHDDWLEKRGNSKLVFAR